MQALSSNYNFAVMNIIHLKIKNMKTHFKTVSFIAAGLLLVSAAMAQPPVPKDDRGPNGGPGVPAPPKAQALQEVTTFAGKVAKLVANNDYVYDGFYLLAGSDSMLVKFSPHLGSQLTKVASVGSSITLNGVANTSPSSRKEIRMVSLTAGGQTISNTLPPVAVISVTETTVTGSGKVSHMQANLEGKVSGFLLDNNTILRIPPAVSDQLSGLVQNGTSVSYTGSKKQLKTGEVATADYIIVRCTTLTVNGKQYLVQ